MLNVGFCLPATGRPTSNTLPRKKRFFPQGEPLDCCARYLAVCCWFAFRFQTRFTPKFVAIIGIIGPTAPPVHDPATTHRICLIVGWIVAHWPATPETAVAAVGFMTDCARPWLVQQDRGRLVFAFFLDIVSVVNHVLPHFLSGKPLHQGLSGGSGMPSSCRMSRSWASSTAPSPDMRNCMLRSGVGMIL